jgi:hypothetical protein
MNDPGQSPHSRFLVEDDFHSDLMETFESYDEALGYLEVIVLAPWGTDPNDPPCGNMACERSYVIIEYDSKGEAWTEIGQHAAVRVTAEGIEWRHPRPMSE